MPDETLTAFMMSALIEQYRETLTEKRKKNGKIKQISWLMFIMKLSNLSNYRATLYSFQYVTLVFPKDFSVEYITPLKRYIKLSTLKFNE